ncbi:ATP phosphoribosyltransferase [Megasphaera vaginalis (ex Srinivasan et al. 2021)]|uniref:ATP phosphoribosyltransferase n=1 Tax=Megasphaera vaginalis (ex Srinivasan et al. 2021) TaxID=1111454 RepID=U7UL62_9FIRM|nr:ATP phosphoribosyltransferase [Megasphaera vaginalis (ex Srinivasan et al. 2021)]ERT59213.1 ATP phosphoribosyltransferase [Megasphaera vaginalis (ex Srinivasan et al. 2021)]
MALHIALAKGRIHKAVMNCLRDSGYDFSTYAEDSRKLIFEDTGKALKVTLVKSPDVAVYVERGAADIGIVGEDVLAEDCAGAAVYEVFDLGIGRCRMAVAAPQGRSIDRSRRLTVGTKYPRLARQYFAAKHHSVDIIKLNGSVELAPLVGLADVIVDIVETGNTLKANGLEVLVYFMDFSARMICNKVAFKVKYEEIQHLITIIGRKEIQ